MQITIYLDGSMPVFITSVGNEHGQVLISVLTKSKFDLKNMAEGLMSRYEDAKMDPPKVMYVSSDVCCDMKHLIKQLFNKWYQLEVRFDLWNFMKKFANGLTSVSHTFYISFMMNLSFAILKWDSEDLYRLKRAKQSEFGEDVTLSIKELTRHCRWRTKGVRETEEQIVEVINQFWNAQDDIKVPLINTQAMTEIWKAQRHHIELIQDPVGIDLFTEVGEIIIGGEKLPIYHCARGSTILQTFHSHLHSFIPSKYFSS